MVVQLQRPTHDHCMHEWNYGPICRGIIKLFIFWLYSRICSGHFKAADKRLLFQQWPRSDSHVRRGHFCQNCHAHRSNGRHLPVFRSVYDCYCETNIFPNRNQHLFICIGRVVDNTHFDAGDQPRQILIRLSRRFEIGISFAIHG